MAVRCSVPIDKKKKDDGKYEIMMAVTMTQQEGPTAYSHANHPFVLDPVGGAPPGH